VWVNGLCAGALWSEAARGRILTWLAEGAREVSWALCSLPREHWTTVPASRLGAWPALRHVRHLVLNEQHVTLPAVRSAFGSEDPESVSSITLDQADAAWDPGAALETADELISDLGSVRFELLQRLEGAPDAVWEQSLAATHAADAPLRLGELMLRARQHELEHLATLWRIALYWDRVSPSSPRHAPAGAVGLALHPADRLEESH
jgi:hypothetical protein